MERYAYDLPSELIRKEGIEPRDASRLFVYDTRANSVTHATFRDIARYLPEQSVMVLNDTRVVPSRLWLRKETGGKIEVFVLANQIRPGMEEIPVLVDRKCVPGWKLFFSNGDYLEIIGQDEKVFWARLRSVFTLAELLEQHGETPLPHYLESETRDEARLRKRYQTLFARAGASVAAPTAALHITNNVLESLQQKDIAVAYVTLDVGLGTFAPLTEKQWQENRLHAEWREVSPETAALVNRAKQAGHPVIAVGTTALRTLESAARNGRLGVIQGETDIFIYPPYQFQIADILVTNFHLPKTSLMLLVDAFLEYKGASRRILELYEEAIRERYTFYSFGDSMLIV